MTPLTSAQCHTPLREFMTSLEWDCSGSLTVQPHKPCIRAPQQHARSLSWHTKGPVIFISLLFRSARCLHLHAPPPPPPQCVYTHMLTHRNGVWHGTTSCCAIAACIKRGLLFLSCASPSVTGATAKNNSRRLQESGCHGREWRSSHRMMISLDRRSLSG